IAMVVILAVMSLVILSVILLTPGKNEKEMTKKLGVYVCGFCVCSRDLVEINPPEREKAVLQYASWGPQGNQLAYVFNGDIYYKPSVTSKSLRLTTTDQEQNVMNGLSDWTYEEEVLLTYVAHWWSMDGARLAYLSINNSATPVMEMPHFLGGLYPSNVLFPYPKAGSNIPSASLFVVNLYGPAHTLEMLPPDSVRARDRYISMVTWISSTRLAVRWLNRAQNQSFLCMYLSYFITPVYTCLLPLSLFWTVNFYFPIVSSLVVNISTGRQCVSCNLIDRCRFFKAEFSPNQTHFTLYCLGPGIPKVTVHSTKDPSRYVILEDNSPLSKALEDKSLPETLFRTITADNHGITKKSFMTFLVLTWCILFVLLLRDGVPGSQSVTEEFALGWPLVLSSTHNVALAWVDGRSGVGRGQKTTAVDPRKLGSLRVKDYLAVVELLMQLPYIDDRRMALYGKAFGGYLTLKMLAATDKLFQCAAAMAPITDFRLYSAAFSERYLGLPAKEEHAYSTASLLEEVSKLKDENFLILHGTADGKNLVHFQQSAELLSRLVKVEANYSLQLYPDEGHILREQRSIQHFQRTVVNYLQNCMKHSALLDTIEHEEEEDD
uniref:Dipeptidyl-peptidase 6b n=1 Tax=Anabas testudineus TaxID=64144 RepID=A0A7N6BK80_ANATE